MNVKKHVWIGMLGILCVLSAGVAFGAQEPADVSQEDVEDGDVFLDPNDPRYRLAVEVELVNLTATVLDNAGRYMTGLTPQDFRIFEDGREQEISFFSHDVRVPISVGLLIDASGSMRHKLQQALQTVREIIAALSPQDEAFVISFASNVELRQTFTSESQELQRALRDIRSGGETAVFDAMQMGVEKMRSAQHNKKILLLVSDGFDTRSRFNLDDVEELLKRADVMVYAIGIDDDDDDPFVLRRTRYTIYHYMLGRVTSLTGGRAFRLFTGRNYALQTLASVLLEELHQQYTLSYYPAGDPSRDGWRDVEIRVQRPGSQVRHRPGYYIDFDLGPAQ